MFLLFFAGAFALGVFLGAFFAFPPYIAGYFLALLALSLALAWRKPPFRVTVLGLMVFIAGAMRAAGPDVGLTNYQGKPVEVTGVVASDPEPRGRTISFPLALEQVKAQGEAKPVSAKVMVLARPFPELVRERDYPYFRYGDRLKLKGVLQEPAPELPDYQAYLASQGITASLLYPQGELVQPGRGPLVWLYTLRQRLSRSLAGVLPQPQASLAQGLLLGLRGDIPAEVREDFVRTGTSHILAISGLHVAIVAGLGEALARGLLGRRSYYIILPLGLLWLYAFLTGFNPPVARSAIMGSLYLFGMALGRQKNSLPALGLAGALMVALSPSVLRDLSFQLSFLATAGLILLSPAFLRLGEKPLASFRSQEGWAKALARAFLVSAALSLGAIIATLPLVAFSFHRVSLVGLPATLLALPALPFILVFSSATALAGLVSSTLALPLGWLTWPWLSYLLGLLQGFSHLPLASFDLGPFASPLLWSYYAVPFAGYLAWQGRIIPRFRAFLPRMRPSLKKSYGLARPWLILLLGLVAILVWAAAATVPPGDLRVFYLDVGQGDAVLIMAPSGNRVLIDGGPDPRRLGVLLGERLPFWDRRLDLVVMTHPDEDHLGGLLGVLRDFPVKAVMEDGLSSSRTGYLEWRKLVEEKSTKVYIAQRGQQIKLGGGVVLEVLHPPQPPLEGTSADDDNNSVALRLVYGELSFLFLGDLRAEGEGELAASGAGLESTVLMPAHHGSRTSTSQTFLDKVAPQVAVISAGKDNPFGHPHEETLNRLEERVGKERIFITADEGTIELRSDGQRLWARREGKIDTSLRKR